MPSAQARPRLGSRGRPEETRTAILQAAVREFAREGIAGARTDAIARAAKVNKALLYYYYRDKDALYGAALDQVARLHRRAFVDQQFLQAAHHLGTHDYLVRIHGSDQYQVAITRSGEKIVP